MSHRYPQRPAQTAPRLKQRCFFKALLTAWGLSALSTMAQTVYRCGNEYSDTRTCPNGSVATVHDARSIYQHQAQDRLTQQTQEQAEALERNRLKAEKQSPRAATPSAAAWSTKDVSPVQDHSDNSTLGSPNPHAHHKKTSPYFTAKDGKNNAKTTTPNKAKQKTTTDTPAKP